MAEAEVHLAPKEVTVFAKKPETIWTGELNSEGRCQGEGEVYLDNGDVYVGGMEDGLKSGSGTYTWVDGQVYKGKYVNGVENGQGTEKYSNGDSYVGEFRDGKKHGKGLF